MGGHAFRYLQSTVLNFPGADQTALIAAKSSQSFIKRIDIHCLSIISPSPYRRISLPPFVLLHISTLWIQRFPPLFNAWRNDSCFLVSCRTGRIGKGKASWPRSGRPAMRWPTDSPRSCTSGYQRVGMRLAIDERGRRPPGRVSTFCNKKNDKGGCLSGGGRQASHGETKGQKVSHLPAKVQRTNALAASALAAYCGYASTCISRSRCGQFSSLLLFLLP